MTVRQLASVFESGVFCIYSGNRWIEKISVAHIDKSKYAECVVKKAEITPVVDLKVYVEGVKKK